MAVVFAADSVGRAVSFSVSGAVPFITMDVDPGLDDDNIIDYGNVSVGILLGSPASGLPTFRDVGAALESQAHTLKTYYSDLIEDNIIAPLGGTANKDPNSRAIRGVLENLNQRRYYEQKLQSTTDPDQRNLINSLLRNTKRAEMSLTQMLTGIGMITTVSGSYSDVPDGASITGTVSKATPSYGHASISGLVFERGCSAGKDTLGSGRHGLERLLEYWYWNRLSNNTTGKPVATMSFTIGKTKLQGYVVGFSFQPVKPEFRLWGWTMRMIISPDYWVDSLGLG